MYRFLLTPRWLGAALLTVVAAVVMVMLGNWQLHRYQERSAINTRIDTADSTKAVPLTSIMSRPTKPSSAGTSPGNALAWTKVTVTGRYDPSHELQARDRTVNGDVGFEILTPLLLDDGTAVLIDRGWVPAPDAGAEAAPKFPPPPTGQVTVVGQIHLSESRPTPIAHRDGRLDTRRISVSLVAHDLPFPVYGAYVQLTEQQPQESSAFTRVPIETEDSWQNAGYTVQWWLFSLMTLYVYGYQAYKEEQVRSGKAPAPVNSRASGLADRAAVASAASSADLDSSSAVGGASVPPAADPATDGAAAGNRALVDRVALDEPAQADRKRAARRKSGDRVQEADMRRSAGKKSGDRVEEADKRRSAQGKADDRVTEADRQRSARRAPVDRVEEADRKRAEREAASAGAGDSSLSS